MSRLVGRQTELDRIEGFLHAARRERAVFALEGEPGIGKSTLWRAAVDRATGSGAVVLSSRPSGAEVTLSFAALGDLLDEHVDDAILALLPPPQREAIAAALLRTTSGNDVMDHRTVAVATLTVLRLFVDRRGPVLVAIDDVQWIDPASALALGFALRRIEPTLPVGVLCAIRSGTGDEPGRELLSSLTEDGDEIVRLAPLDPGSLGEVIQAHLGRSFPVPLLNRIHQASRGNAFFAVEIGRALVEFGVSMEPGAPLPAPPGLEAAVRKRIAVLPEAAREVLLIAAASPRPARSTIAAAIGAEAELGLAAGQRAGIVHVAGDQVSFAHPLFASVVYTDATAEQRRDVHGRLARIVSDVEERARHSALAVDGSDDAVADELEAAARQARARGANASAAELLEMAATRTSPVRGDDIRRRSLDAADLHLLAGDHERALILTEPLIDGAPVGQPRAEVLLHVGMALMTLGRYVSAARVLVTAAGEPGVDPRTASSIHLWCGWTTTYAGDPVAGVRHATLAVERAEEAGDDVALASGLGLLAMLRMWSGKGIDREMFERALAMESSVDPFFVSDRPAFYYVAALGQGLGQTLEAKRLLEDLLRLAIERGDEVSMLDLRFSLGDVELKLGHFASAREHFRAARSRTPSASSGWDTALAARAAAIVGDMDEARYLAGHALSDPEAARMSIIESEGALGLVELELGDSGAALPFLRQAWAELRSSGIEEPGMILIPVDLVEALVAVGDLTGAEEIVSWLQERGDTLDRALALAHAARGRALVLAARGDLHAALSELDRALAHHERVAMPFERARTSLIRGIVLRRANRKGEARTVLAEAASAFDTMGATPWADRTRDELTRISGRRPSADVLTSTEERVARLAAAGRSNREIGDELYLSVRTVESHLSHAYRKLGVRSRTELSSALAD